MRYSISTQARKDSGNIFRVKRNADYKEQHIAGSKDKRNLRQMAEETVAFSPKPESTDECSKHREKSDILWQVYKK